MTHRSPLYRIHLFPSGWGNTPDAEYAATTGSAMTTAVSWIVNAGGDWSTAANWTGDALPNSSDVVTISTANVQSITHNSNTTEVIDKLTVGQDFFSLGGGGLDISTTASFADGYTQTAGTLTVGTSAAPGAISITGDYTQSGGTLNAGAVSISGLGNLFGGASEGATTFTVTGTTTLANYTLGGGSVLKVTAAANETGQVILGDATGVNATIRTAATGVYSISGDGGITDGASSALFSNAGTLEKSAGSGTSVVAVSVISAGTISAVSGDLQFSGPTNSISGTLSGAGQISFGGGVTTLGAVSITAGTLGIYGTATVKLTAGVTYDGVFVDQSDGTSTLSLGVRSLTLGGATAAFLGVSGSANITGSGTLTNKSVMTLSNVDIGGSVNVSNTTTIDQIGTVTVGDGLGGAPSITNVSTGTYDFTDDAALGEDNATVTFLNQGLFEKTGGAAGQDSLISLAVTNSGTINAQVGALAFVNSVVNTGTIGGAGAVIVTGAGALALNAGSVLSVANFELSDTASLTLGASLSYAGVFDDSSVGTDEINLAGNTLTLSGAGNTMQGVSGVTDLAGTGKLANTGTLSLGSAVIDGSTQIDNTGTINEAQNITIGGGGGQVASIVNAKGAHFNVSGALEISNGAATASHFDNSGTVVVSGGTGIATFATTFNNLTGGVINVSTGTLQNVGVLINSGTISGTHLVLGGSGQTNLNAGTVLSVSEVDLNGAAVLNLGATLNYAGDFVDASNGNNTLNLGTSTLTLSGQTEFDPNSGDDIITGSGSLRLIHATNLEGGAVVVGGTANLAIGAAVTVAGTLQVGDGSANAARVSIASTGTYDLVADNIDVTRGASAASTLVNAGLFEKTAGTGTSDVSVDFVNNGTITVTSGTLEFVKGTLTNNGTINGTVSFDSNGDELITAKAAAKAATPAPKMRPMGASPASVHLLAQAVAAFGADQGLAALSGHGAMAQNDALTGLVSARRLI
jgi:fibronectin-binding autotransporter adhesin